MSAGSGPHPMGRRPDPADIETMTVLAPTYDTRRGRFGRAFASDTALRRDELPAAHAPALDLRRELSMNELRDRIDRNAYQVDPQAVATAIVERLQVGAGLVAAATKPA